ncbi:urokinase plasminogen activator surface receptor-like [Spea bombifrons]|uniref:urokinase plasminogen activator surface receptor-like n=1 Tax=Spea bombifrons TaxID=233779 RepID=UPI002349EE0B|nr:urokinase plasminogen activator surface receptor-like [Spea bombifrons]
MFLWLILLSLCVCLRQGLSLTCYQCSGLPYNCIENEQRCFFNQTFCMSQGITVIENGNVVEKTYKGCSQGLLCNETMYMNQGNRKTYISSQCCTSDYCNTGTYYARVPVAALDCLTCVGDNSSCALQNLTSIKCTGVQDRCMTITTVYVKETSSNSVIKGCGTGNLCDRKLEYNTGNGLLYTGVSCCGKNNCNNRTQTVSVDPKPNGLECYACNETGKGECRTNITTVKCTGDMMMCMDVTGFPRANTLMRGCCSKDVCLGLSASLAIQASQKLFCCSGNLCNNGDIASYFRSSSTTALNNVYLLGMALLCVTRGLRVLL